MGCINQFNGVDVTQSSHFNKISTHTYITKILKDKPWISSPSHTSPIPMNPDNVYNHNLEQLEPLTDHDLKVVEDEYGFSYKQDIGEHIYVMVTCRPDIFFPFINLSQYSSKPANNHFETVKQLYLYIQSTKDDGIYYWTPTPRHDLPLSGIPVCRHQNNYDVATRTECDPFLL